MNRTELEAKLQGVEKASEIISYIMKEHGLDIAAEQAKAKTAVEAEQAKAKASLDEAANRHSEELKKYAAINLDEVNELKKFKENTEKAQVAQKKEAAIVELLKNEKASEKSIKLLAKQIDIDKAELDEQGKLKNGADLIKPIKTEFAEHFLTITKDGATAGNPANSDPAITPQPKNYKEAVAQYYSNKK